MKQNLVLFMPDQLRADALGCYGHPLVQTPNLDAFAERSVLFETCQAVSPLCPVSRCDMFTGLPPHATGRRMFGNLLEEHRPHLFRYLKENGYDVYWYGRNDLIVQDGVAHAATEWNSFEDTPAWAIAGSPYDMDDPRYFSLLFQEGGPHEDLPDSKRVQRAIEVLERRVSDRPFCLFLPLFYPHPPFTGPEGYHNMYAAEDVPALRPADLDTRPAFYRKIRESRNLHQLDDLTLRKINAVYLGMITYVDMLFGKMMGALADTGHADDTTVVFFSDHGEWGGDYGLVEKWGTSMDDALIRVPLIINSPGLSEPRRVEEVVSLRDLMATLLEICEIEPRHRHFSKSLCDVLAGGAEDLSRAAFSEGGYSRAETQCFLPLERYAPGHIYRPKHYLEMVEPELISRTVCVRTREHKLVWRPELVSELYDLTADPGETRNLFADPAYAPVQEDLMKRLLDWFVLTSDVVEGGTMPMELPKVPA
ncbi:MAG: sulfatase-like hydrolase/transferase [Pseudomonadota bacterium]|nr:sulfatase-like hydrolase/transferase [Pseudomonadota bacterium]